MTRMIRIERNSWKNLREAQDALYLEPKPKPKPKPIKPKPQKPPKHSSCLLHHLGLRKPSFSSFRKVWRQCCSKPKTEVKEEKTGQDEMSRESRKMMAVCAFIRMSRTTAV